MMKFTDNVQRLLELIDAAADTSKMQRIIYIENARMVAAEFDKKDWAQLVKFTKSMNGIQFNMLISVGIKKPFRAEIFKNRIGRFE